MKKILLGLWLTTMLVGCIEKEKVVEENWEVSPTFEVPVTFSDGTKGEYILIGEEGKLGLFIGSGKEGEAEAPPIMAKKVNKYMWHFWSEKEEWKGKLKVVGINEKGEEHKVLISHAGTPNSEKVWEYSEVRIIPHEAETKVPSNMEFPTPGLWKLKVYVGNRLFGEIVVNVLER
ncbi:DUF4871 domain-containing protein [Neobacillus thermocopriae]|uniref:DUF4871 domain-containing protein n=1 Tax=Neobacillus thermocopriae TaxID=1215031 RepID=UPI00376F5B00